MLWKLTTKTKSRHPPHCTAPRRRAITVQTRNVIKIGRPGYKVTKARDLTSNQRSLLFEVDYPEAEDGAQPRHRFMSAYEQKVEAPDKGYQVCKVLVLLLCLGRSRQEGYGGRKSGRCSPEEDHLQLAWYPLVDGAGLHKVMLLSWNLRNPGNLRNHAPTTDWTHSAVLLHWFCPGWLVG